MKKIGVSILILYTCCFDYEILAQELALDIIDTLKYYKQSEVRSDVYWDSEFTAIKRNVIFTPEVIYNLNDELSKSLYHEPNNNKGLQLSNLIFLGTVQIGMDSEFDEEIKLNNVHVFREFYFNNISATSKKFSQVTFHKEIDFIRPTYSNSIEFYGCDFLADIDILTYKFEHVSTPEGGAFSIEDEVALQIKDSLIFDHSYFKKGLNLYDLELPKYLSFNSVKSDQLIKLSATTLPHELDNETDHCLINLYDAPIEKFDFSYENFRLFTKKIDNVNTYEKTTYLYERLLNHFKIKGQLNSYEKLDKEYQKFKLTKNPDANFSDLILDIINKEWNDYGYNKGKIWTWTAGFFLFFWLINWLRFPFIYQDAYKTPSMSKSVDIRALNIGDAKVKPINFRALDLSLYYTVIIFFGLKIESKNFNFENLRGMLYIGFQYLIGLICLAYLANFVINSGVIGS